MNRINVAIRVSSVLLVAYAISAIEGISRVLLWLLVVAICGSITITWVYIVKAKAMGNRSVSVPAALLSVAFVFFTYLPGPKRNEQADHLVTALCAEFPELKDTPGTKDRARISWDIQEVPDSQNESVATLWVSHLNDVKRQDAIVTETRRLLTNEKISRVHLLFTRQTMEGDEVKRTTPREEWISKTAPNQSPDPTPASVTPAAFEVVPGNWTGRIVKSKPEIRSRKCPRNDVSITLSSKRKLLLRP